MPPPPSPPPAAPPTAGKEECFADENVGRECIAQDTNVTSVSESTAFTACLHDADCKCINKEDNVAGKTIDGVVQTAAMVAVSPYIYKTKGPEILATFEGGVASYARNVFSNAGPPNNLHCDYTASYTARRLQPMQPLASWDDRH